MKDTEIIELYFKRDENAIIVSEKKYGSYCRKIAYSVLENSEDTEECINDTWLRAWKAMPPQRPDCLSAFFAKITRNLAFDRYKALHNKKRGEITLILDELSECIPSSENTEQTIILSELAQKLNQFLHGLPERERHIFLSRYWYSESIQKISKQFSLSVSNVKTILFRTRQKLKTFLEREKLL